MGATNQVALVIPLNGDESNAVQLSGTLAGYFMPDAITGTITLEAKNKVTGAWTIFAALTGDETTYYPLDPAETFGLEEVRIVSDAAEAAERKFVLVTRR